MSEKKRTIILGAGPAGLATGHELAANSSAVTVLEKNKYVGGLCRTVSDQGYKFDLGGHRWFTKNEELNNWFRRLMDGEYIWVDRISRIYYDGKYFMYPVQFGDVIKKAGPITMVHAGFSYVWAAIQYSVLGKKITNMQESYTAQFGSKLYDMFFRRYSEKVWGRPCTQLSADWINQRSKGLSIWTVVQEALAENSNKKQVTSLIDKFMYPRDGYMRIPERMAEDIQKAGNDVLLDATVSKIVYHNPNDFEVQFVSSSGTTSSVRGTDVVSTIPLSLLAQLFEPKPDQAIIDAAKSLKFRDLITVNVMIQREQVSLDTWLYIQDEQIIFGRMHEPKNWSKAMVPDNDHTSLVLECFCEVGDHIWEMDDDSVARQCVKDLTEKLKFLNENEVIGWQVVRTRHAYPVYDIGYLEKTKQIKTYLEKFVGMQIVGRGGTFRYNNADHSIEMGLLLGRKILGYDVDHMGVNTEQEYQEEIRATDIDRDHYKMQHDSASSRPS